MLGSRWRVELEGNPIRVLVVEDDIEVSRAVTRQLRAHGYEVVVTPSCATTEALTCCFDIGVFDIELSDGNGADLAATLLASGLVDNVVFFTATTFGPYLRQAVAVGQVVHKRDGIEALVHALADEVGCRSVSTSLVVAKDDAEATPDDKKRSA